jgi:hypothetical protein
LWFWIRNEKYQITKKSSFLIHYSLFRTYARH